MKRVKKPSLTGQRFGKWTVGEEVEGRKPTQYDCVCECGTKRVITAQNLIRGLSTQCSLCRNAANLKEVCSRGHKVSTRGRSKGSYNCKQCQTENRKILVSTPKRKEKSREKRLWDLYRLTLEDWSKVDEFQGKVCAVSNRPPGKTRLSIDHNHLTGELRGLLSFNINKGLAYFNDDPALLRAAADYLDNPTVPQALGHKVFGLIGQARYKRTMRYGSENGPLPLERKHARKTKAAKVS